MGGEKSNFCGEKSNQIKARWGVLWHTQAGCSLWGRSHQLCSWAWKNHIFLFQGKEKCVRAGELGRGADSHLPFDPQFQLGNPWFVLREIGLSPLQGWGCGRNIWVCFDLHQRDWKKDKRISWSWAPRMQKAAGSTAPINETWGALYENVMISCHQAWAGGVGVVLGE